MLEKEKKKKAPEVNSIKFIIPDNIEAFLKWGTL